MYITITPEVPSNFNDTDITTLAQLLKENNLQLVACNTYLSYIVAAFYILLVFLGIWAVYKLIHSCFFEKKGYFS